MSYLRDPDRRTRGVGAIAARDKDPRRRDRFGFGDDKASGGPCYVYYEGAYYVGSRKLTGGLDEAKRYPPCTDKPSQPPTTTSATPRAEASTRPIVSSTIDGAMRTSTAPVQTYTGSRLALQQLVKQPAPASSVQTYTASRSALQQLTQPSAPVQTYTASRSALQQQAQQTAQPVQTYTASRSALQQALQARQQAQRYTASQEAIRQALQPLQTQTFAPGGQTTTTTTTKTTTSGGGSGAGISTSSSASPNWMAPSVEEETAAPTPAAQNTSRRNGLIAIGVGIGLLYLLTRDED